jgi:type IV pilus assembly protein PilC
MQQQQAQSTFAFKARDSSGDIVTGSMVASTADEVGARLRAEGKYVLNIDDKPMRGDVELDAMQVRRNEAAKRVRREDVIAFCQQLAVMLETGVPLAEALDAFCRQTARKEFKVVLNILRDDIYGGETFSAAMSKWPRVFPRMMVSLMKASEASGTMALMLGRIGEYLGKERRTLKQIKGALAYPMFMMVAGLTLSIFLMVVILPRFATIYEGKAAALPPITVWLLTISEFMTTKYMYYGPTLLVTAIIAAIFFSRPVGKRSLDWLRLHIPLLGHMFRQLYITRSARTMATLIIAGVNLLDIIDICRGVTSNNHFDTLWDDMAQGVRDGRQISEAFENCEYIPPNVASMVASGERSGQLGDVMERIASFSEEELDSAVKQVTAYVEPIMVIVMGILVGGVAMALLLPIFKMGSVMAGG